MTWVYPYTESELNYCPWCRNSEGVTHLELCSLYSRTDGGWLLSYPGNGGPVAYVSHPDCGPDVGYAIEIKRLISAEDLRDWLEHLRGKIWNCKAFTEALYTTNAFYRHGSSRIRTVKQPFIAQRSKSKTISRSVSTVKTYLIQSQLGGDIKIGKSTNPESRLKSLQTGRADKLQIKKIIDGDHEKELHSRYSHLRISGEWFRCEAELEVFIRGGVE